MKCGEVNMPVEAPSALSSAVRCATVEPLPLVPPTVMTGNAGSATPRARATAATRVSSMSMLLGCTDSCSVSHSASVRIGPKGLGAARASGSGGRQLQQQPQQRRDPVAHLAAVDNHVDGSVVEQEFAALEALRQGFAHGLLDDAGPGEADQRARLGEVQVPEQR